MTFDDIAAMASEISGKGVERIVVDDDQWIADMVAAGRPEGIARMTLSTFLAARDGRLAGVDPLLGELLGREPAPSPTISPTASPPIPELGYAGRGHRRQRSPNRQ